MSKTYDIPIITIHVSGGVVQDVDIPKETNTKVRVKDYDCDVEPDSEEAQGHVIKEDEHGTYEEGVWEND